MHFTVNREPNVADVDIRTTLLDLVREHLGLTVQEEVPIAAEQFYVERQWRWTPPPDRMKILTLAFDEGTRYILVPQARCGN